MNAFQLFSEPFTNALGWALVHALWQGTALVALAALAFRFTAHQPASVRYGIGIGALALQLVTFAGTLRFCYEPVSPVVMIKSEETALLQQTALVMNPTDNGLSVLTGWLQQHISLLVAVWLVGALLLVIRLVGGWLFVQRLTHRNNQPAPEAWQAHLHRLANQLGVTKIVRLVESMDISVPMTIGWLKPVVLIPVGLLAGLSPREVAAVLAHELAHIRRYDYLVNLLQSVVEIVLFFHPAIWWLSAKVREEREHCCDDIAIHLCGERASLAQALVHIEERRQATLAAPALAMAFGARKPSFIQRVKRVIGINEPQTRSKPNGLVVAGCLVLLTGLVTGQHTYRPVSVSRREGDSVTINAWEVKKKGQVAIDNEVIEPVEPVFVAYASDTIDPQTRLKLKQELEHHNREIERLDREMEKLNQPIEKLNKEVDLNNQLTERSDKEMEVLNQKMELISKDLERNVQKSVELQLKQSRLNGKLSEVEASQLAKAKQAILVSQQKMETLQAGEMARIQEKIQKLSEGPLKMLSDSVGVFSAKMAKLAEKTSFHAVEAMKIHQQLDSLPVPVPAIAPVPDVRAMPAPTPRPARAPRPPKVKPAGVKGEYWYNGKRYNRPEDMPPPPAPASAPNPVPAVAPAAVPEPPAPPVPAAPAQVESVPDGSDYPNPPARAKSVKFKAKSAKSAKPAKAKIIQKGQSN